MGTLLSVRKNKRLRFSILDAKPVKEAEGGNEAE